ncbi:MAG: HD domain-containing protein [Phycisphaerae bacterium]|nr:HD domain-containing protein [Phycisphaerae bacterium]
MPEEAVQTSGASGSTPPAVSNAGDPRACLQVLLSGGGAQDGGATKAALEGLSDSVERVLREHAGMTEELLSIYEQLGMVFDVCGRLPSAGQESAVLNLFLESLRQSFRGREVLAYFDQRNGRWSVAGRSADEDAPAELAAILERLPGTRGARVESVVLSNNGEAVSVELMVGPVYAGDNFVCAIVLIRGAGAPEFQASDMNLLDAMATFCGDLISNRRLVRELRQLSVAVVRSLVNAVDQKDPYTSGHSIRVAYFATVLGERLGLPDSEVQMLQWAGLLHDVGKIGIRDDVLKKPGKLTKEEFDHMKEHPVRSFQVVEGVPQLQRALPGVLHHHERFGGGGYPGGLRGEEIPLQARIIQVADIFDALTSDRAYRAAYDWKGALEILKREAGTTVDPHIQQTFDTMMHLRLDGDENRWAELIAEAERFTLSSSLDGFVGEGL